jgi:MFS transporter, DHA1 family, multidrug resistance protein
MSATATTGAPKPKLVAGSRRFILTLAMCMAVTALGVDTALPAFGDIRESLGLAPDAVEVTRLITYFLLGNSLGLLPAGLLADRFGRKPVMYGGLVLYVIGAAGTMLAPSLGMMLAARFVWGLGSSGPRVAAMAMVRDSYAGEQMAKQMSFIMAIFIIVPTVAPLLASGILLVGPWQAVFGFCAAMAALLSLAVTRLPETIHVDDRRSLAAGAVWDGWKIVLTTPGTLGYLVSLTALQAVFISYLASSEVVVDQVFGLGDYFPLYFSGLALVMGVAMYANGRVVVRVGLDRMIKLVFVADIVASALMVLVALPTGGTPPFVLFVAVQGLALFTHQMLIPNLNAAAMRPLASVAGTGSALLGMIPGVVGSILGGVIDARFDGTVTPLSLAFLAAGVIAIAAWSTTARGATARASRTSAPAARPATPAARRPGP